MRNSCAIAAGPPDPGRWNGMRRMSVLFSRQRILSLWRPRLSTDRLTRLGARSTEAKPTGVYGKRGNVAIMVALDRSAERRGLCQGLAMARARAMQPAIAAVEEEPQADAKLLDKL